LKDLLERELCARILVESTPLGEGECREPVYLLADGDVIVEGLPGEEGYLVEVLKSSLGGCRGGSEGKLDRASSQG
jgi:hypothetical protein